MSKMTSVEQLAAELNASLAKLQKAEERVAELEAKLASYRMLMIEASGQLNGKRECWEVEKKLWEAINEDR